jgi:hypothetical protein
MRAAILSSLLFFAACSGSTDTRLDCDETGKCDTPGGTVREQCTNSRVNAMDEKRPHFTGSGVRWSCKDVNGVTPNGNTSDDRGQEYCEYFTMLHTNGIPEVLLDGSGSPVFCDESTPCATGTCNTEIFSCVSSGTVVAVTPASAVGQSALGALGAISASGVTMNLGAASTGGAPAQSGSAISFSGGRYRRLPDSLLVQPAL